MARQPMILLSAASGRGGSALLVLSSGGPRGILDTVMCGDTWSSCCDVVVFLASLQVVVQYDPAVQTTVTRQVDAH
jgi:hypothetical protein